MSFNLPPHITVARVVETHEEIEQAGPGTVQYYNNRDGVPAGMFFRCPGCNALTSIGFDRWRLIGDPSRPTLDPSLIHDSDEGGCGWNGWLRNGGWRAV